MLKQEKDLQKIAFERQQEHLFKKQRKKLKNKVKDVAKDVKEKAREVKEGISKAIDKAKDKLPNVDARYLPLVPFKNTMKKELQRRGIKTDNKLRNISRLFYQNVVKNNVLPNENLNIPPTNEELVGATVELAKENKVPNVTPEKVQMALQLLQQKQAKEGKAGEKVKPMELLEGIPDPTVQAFVKGLKTREKITGQELDWADFFAPTAIIRFFKGLREKAKRGGTDAVENRIARDAEQEVEEKKEATTSEVVNEVTGETEDVSRIQKEKEKEEEEEKKSNTTMLLVAAFIIFLLAK